MSAGQVTCGTVLSFTVTPKEHWLAPSLHVVVDVPTGKKAPEETGIPFVVQLVAAPQTELTSKGTFAPHWVEVPVPTVMLSGHVIEQATGLSVKQKLPHPPDPPDATMTNVPPLAILKPKPVVWPPTMVSPLSPR
jgi:hypothetical protein